MAVYKAENTRKFKRVQAHSLVKFHAAEKWGGVEPFLANIKDISAGGLHFWSGVFFPEGTLLRISAWIPALKQPLDALARIVRVHGVKTGDSYYLSIRFIEVDQEVQSALNDFIESLVANPKTRRFIDSAGRKIRRTKVLSRV